MAKAILWNCWNWRSNGTVDHTFRLAVRTLGTCRILGNGFSRLHSVSHHLELAHRAFTSRLLDEQVALIVTRSATCFPLRAFAAIGARARYIYAEVISRSESG
jgi:hypothetical protein